MFVACVPANGGDTHQIDLVYDELRIREGSGDTVTDIPTGDLGVTQTAREAVGASSNAPDRHVSRAYLNLLDGFWRRQPGYNEAPTKVKAALLDTTYNLGTQIFSFEGVLSALERGDYFEVGLQLLDTANVEGKSMMGLAKRRAQAFNLISDEKIILIRQDEDGKITYGNFERVLFSYTPRGGRHELSRTGFMLIHPEPSGLW